MTDSPELDLDAYFTRIGYSGPRQPTLAVLKTLQAAHVGTIPFENIDVRLGRPIGLDLAALQAKLVRGRRGGYCFEHNTLFASVLRAFGFEVATLEARVRPPGATQIRPRTHMVLLVTIDGCRWLADVGFGGDCAIYPVAFDSEAVHQPGGAYRIVEDGALHVLQLQRKSAWEDLYAFTLLPAYPIDYEVANHYTSTHPRSVFVQTLTVQITKPEARHYLRGRSYTIRSGDNEDTRELGESEIVRLMREPFGLVLPEEDILRAVRQQ